MYENEKKGGTTSILFFYIKLSTQINLNLLCTAGILTAQLFGLPQVMGTPESWPLLLATTGVFSIIQLAVLPFFPESPRYLLIEKKQEPSARAGICHHIQRHIFFSNTKLKIRAKGGAMINYLNCCIGMKAIDQWTQLFNYD